MKQSDIMLLKVSEAKKSAQPVELEIFNKYLGKTRLRSNTTMKDAVEIISQGWGDLDDKRIEKERLERTGVKADEDGNLPDSAELVIGDILNGLNLGDDRITITPSNDKEYSCFIHGKQVA